MTTALGKRVRKVTLTEIEEGQEVDWDSQVEKEVDVSTDELFTKLDAMVQFYGCERVDLVNVRTFESNILIIYSRQCQQTSRRGVLQ